MLNRLFPQRNFNEGEELAYFGDAPRDTFGPVIRVLVWNILKAQRRGWAGDFTNLVQDRDLVLLQESVIGKTSDHLFSDSSRFEWIMAKSFHDPRTGVDHGVKTGSIVSATASRSYFSPHVEPLAQTKKMLLETRYRLPESASDNAAGHPRELLVLNMHAINFVTIQKYVRQLGQLEQALDDYSGAVILAGDFNTWNPNRLKSFKRIAENAELLEVAMQRQTRLAHLHQHLDHLHYRGLELRSAESLSWLNSSDHAPITATFEIV